jgi:RHS repeat-associated protein
MRATAAPDLSSYSYSGTGYVTSDANMNVAQWFDYAPYGSVIATANTGQTTAGRQFEGLFNDATNLVYSNARYLNPSQGQFITQDPIFWNTQQNIQDPQSLNSYSYSEDNPIVKSDPSGKFSPALFIPALFVPEVSVPTALLMYGGAAISGIVAGTAIYNAYQNSTPGAPGFGPLREAMIQNTYSTDPQMGGPIGRPPGNWGPATVIGTGLFFTGACVFFHCEDWADSQENPTPSVSGGAPSIVTPVTTQGPINWNAYGNGSPQQKQTSPSTPSQPMSSGGSSAGQGYSGGLPSLTQQYISVLQQTVSVLQGIIRSYGATPVK